MDIEKEIEVAIKEHIDKAIIEEYKYRIKIKEYIDTEVAILKTRINSIIEDPLNETKSLKTKNFSLKEKIKYLENEIIDLKEIIESLKDSMRR